MKKKHCFNLLEIKDEKISFNLNYELELMKKLP